MDCSDKCFGEADIGQRILEGDVTACRQGGSLKCSHPHHAWDFCSLSAVFPSELGDLKFIHDLEILHLIPWVFFFYCS
jgi:hypothetical protein